MRQVIGILSFLGPKNEQITDTLIPYLHSYAIICYTRKVSDGGGG